MDENPGDEIMIKKFPLYYETRGEGKNPCIILISGIGGQLTDWPQSLIDGLVENGFYVLAFDNRDSGLSHHYEELGIPDINQAISNQQLGKTFKPPYTIQDMASDVISLMDELHVQKAHIIGMSMGGIIAQYVALNFRNRVRSLTCIASTSSDPQLPPSKKEVLSFFATSLTTQEQTLEAFVNNKLQLFRIYNHPDSFDEEKTKEQIIAAYKRGNYPIGFKRLLLAMISDKPRTEQLKKLKVPCLIIHGDYDPVFPVEHGKHLAACITNSHLEIIKNMGHGLPDFACKLISDLIVKYLLKHRKGYKR